MGDPHQERLAVCFGKAHLEYERAKVALGSKDLKSDQELIIKRRIQDYEKELRTRIGAL